MLVPSATMALEWHATDRDKGRALVTMRLPFATSVADADSVTTQLHDKMTPLVNCVFTRVGWRWIFTEDAPETAAIGSNTRRQLALFYRNGDLWEAFYLPSPDPSIFETDGPYAGIRVDMSNPTVVAAIADLTAALAAVVTPEGDPFPDEFQAGGLVI